MNGDLGTVLPTSCHYPQGFDVGTGIIFILHLNIFNRFGIEHGRGRIWTHIVHYRKLSFDI